MEIGKLPNELLEQLVLKPLQNQAATSGDFIVQPKLGEDCGAMQFGDELIVFSTDPITGASADHGKLLLNICTNDIAACGARPVAMTVTALFPPDTSQETIKTVMNSIYEEAKALNIMIISGHTEITNAVNAVVLSGTAIGKVDHGKKFIPSDGGQVGQAVIITKWAGLEGTSILAHAFEEELTKVFGKSFVTRAQKLNKLLSVIPESAIASELKTVAAMHDITEGGILGSCYEMSAKNRGLAIDLSKVPVKEETQMICNYFNINPYKLISSGSLMLVAADGEKLVRALNENQINATVVGQVHNGPPGYFEKDGSFHEITQTETDALYSAKSQASKNRITVLFLCTGNTCRSPMAEAFAKTYAKKRDLGAQFFSRGMQAFDGAPASDHAITIMQQEHGIDLSEHRSHNVTADDIAQADIILTMSAAHKSFLCNHFGAATDRIYTLAEYAYGKQEDIPDPYGGTLETYKSCAGYLSGCVEAIIDKLATQ